jgi:hypothetical protein
LRDTASAACDGEQPVAAPASEKLKRRRSWLGAWDMISGYLPIRELGG